MDALASGGRTGTLSFSVDPIADADRTLPPETEPQLAAEPRVAGFEIIGVLGEGGMGIVFKARQMRLERYVALKMIRAGKGARPLDLARFEAEARVVASIEHPNIVRIFEIGEQGGIPYISLEYLSGGSLAKKIGGKPQPTGEAARIVSTLVAAVAVAHERGIVHRDLKPANVMIAADGTFKVTDFGLAKRLDDDSNETRSGAILGTPCYMSPEQAGGESHRVGPASDQYALGAILYELLTGHPPFQGASVLDTLEQVREKEPVPPSHFQSKVPRDLETICLKCLEKDPGRRYADVSSLAEDLRRYQAGEPIVARPVSPPARLWRWCLRNKGVASLGTAAAAFLLVAAAVSVAAAVMIGQKNQALSATNVALMEAKSRAESKQRLAEDAARAANEQNRNAVDTEVSWISILEDKLRYVPDLDEVREQMLTGAIKNLDNSVRAMTSLRNVIGWDPMDEEKNWRSLARARQRLGDVSLRLNRITAAMEQYRLMDELIETQAKANPGDPMAQFRLARTRRLLGSVAAQKLGDSALGQTYLKQAIEINRACLKKAPQDDTFKRELANSLGQLAEALALVGHLDEARLLIEEESAVRKSFSAAMAADRESRRELSGMYEQLADLKFRMNDPREGRQLYERSSKIREQVVAENPGFWPAVYDLARSYNNAGKQLYPRGNDPAAARAYHRKALALIEARASTEPENSVTKAMLAETLYYEANCAFHSSDPPGAAAGYRRCLEIRKALVTDPKAKMSKVNLMVALARCGEHAEAAGIAQEMAESPPTSEVFYFQAGCGYALAAGCVPGDAALAERYTSAAIACLRQAKLTGWNDVESLEIDPDLEPIRKSPQFRELLAEFKKPRAQQ